MPKRPVNRLLASTSLWQYAYRTIACLLATVAVLGCATWGWMALQAQLPQRYQIAFTVGIAWAFAWVILLGYGLLQRRIFPIVIMGTILMVGFSMWWATIEPLADRDWAPEVMHLPSVEIDAANPALVTIHNVRNFTWHSQSDATPHWETRTYDLDQLDRMDIALSYWMGPAIAHTLVSFGFKNGQHAVFSIEIRKESHEEFDATAGFFKQYELALVAADERDILGVRTNMRGEQVHLYRINLPQQAMRELFMAYAYQADSLRYTPRFYNTLTSNCTTIVWQLARKTGQDLPLDWRLLASGYLPEYLRDIRALDSMQPLNVMRNASNITQRAKNWKAPEGATDEEASADFSRYIRRGM